MAATSGIHLNPSHAGALHRHLGISESKPIPMEKLHEAAQSTDGHVRQMANFAINSRAWKHPKDRPREL